MSTSALDRECVERLLAVTRRMSAAAAASDWTEVARGDAERRELLASAADARGEAPSGSLVRTLREADDALLARAREARATLGERTRHNRAERDVCRTYADVMRSVGAGGADG